MIGDHITEHGGEPTRRIRISHKVAYKRWSHETTVELTHTGEPVQMYEALIDALEQADTLGRAESARRNALDAREAGS